MIYELRCYVPHPGKMESLLARFRDHTRALFEKHGVQNVGYWVAMATDDRPGTSGPDGELWYILGFESDEQRKSSIAAFSASPEWAALREATEADGPLIAEHTIRVLRPADFSAIR